MRYIHLQIIPCEELETEDGERMHVNTRDQLLKSLKFVGAHGGVDIEQLESVLNVRAKIKATAEGDIVSLEESEWKLLCGFVKSVKFNVVDAALLTFKQLVMDAPTKL